MLNNSRIVRTCADNGESIEEMLRRMTTNKEPIPADVPPIYTPYKDGIIPDYDIRADRFDVAIQAQDKFAASEIAKGAEMGDLADIAGKDTTTEKTEGKEE